MSQQPFELVSVRQVPNGLHFYSLKADGAARSLAAAFFDDLQQQRLLPATLPEVQSFAVMFAEMGRRRPNLLAYDRRGNRDYGVLRDESRAAALPPEAFYVRHDEVLGELQFLTGLGLRLYCYPAHAHVLVLFSGGYKTKANPRDCPNVRARFDFALRAARALDRARADGEWHIERNAVQTPDGQPLTLWI